MSSQQKYTFAEITLPEAGRTIESLNINDQGQIVGDANKGTARFPKFYGFEDDHGNFTNLPEGIYPSGFNDSGAIVGSQGNQGIVLLNGTTTIINYPGSSSTMAFGINNQGQVVGSYNASTPTTYGFLEKQGIYETIASPDSTYTVAGAVNDQDMVIGIYYDSSSSMKEHGFLYTDGSFKTIDAPGAFYTLPGAINDFGEIVGYYIQSVNGLAIDHGFIYQYGKLTTFDIPGATDTCLTGLNNLGQITGLYTDAKGQHAFVETPKYPTTV